MNINVLSLSKKYNNDWIFKDFSYSFEINNQYALLGNNGSGKSTLLRILSGMQQFTSGTISYTQDGKEITGDKIFKYISFTAPSMQLIEEMTLSEFLKFHFSIKKILPDLDLKQIVIDANLDMHYDKQIADFSSGMRQKVKLIQAFGSDSKMLLLDEPCSNLDKDGILFYQNCLKKYAQDRITIIASNDTNEYENVEHLIVLDDYKKK